jgi:hypothetical protein
MEALITRFDACKVEMTLSVIDRVIAGRAVTYIGGQA